ncbi:IQ motif and ubiquitin-like domain-containing protein isoform 2-T5 [Geothlypis trichas]
MEDASDGFERGWNQQSPSQNSVLPESTEKGTMTVSMIQDNGTPRNTWPNFENQECLPGEVIQQDYHMPDVITVRVETGSNSFQEVVVKVERPTYNKPFLGGFRNVSTGVEFHNAGSQTKPKKRPDKGIQLFCRGTQTVVEKNAQQQTRNTTSTQMTKTGLYVSNMTDKLITPGKYFTAEEYHKRRVEAVIVIQKYFRRWHAAYLVQNLKEQRRLRLAREAQEELQKKWEKEEKLRREYEKKLNPKTREDFELLYHDLQLWMQEETERINRTLTGAKRKAALYALLEEETELIACIGMHKLSANLENQQKAILQFLGKCAQPRRWKAFDGKITEMDTQNSLRGKELLKIYHSINIKDIPKDERISVLLTLKWTVKEHECKLTQEIVALIDREIDLISREVKECNLEGLRKRICTLFLQYIKTPEFNPQVAGLIKLPDMQYLIENIWNGRSALSACSDLYELVMVRWDKQHEWSPWNTILLTKEEADAHLKLCNLQKTYEAPFIYRIEQKLIRAKNYFARIPAMASFLHRSNNQSNANSYQKNSSSKLKK